MAIGSNKICAHVQRRSALFFLVSIFFFFGVLVPLEKERMSEQDGRTDRRVNCSHIHTHSFVRLLFISQMTRRKNKKKQMDVYYTHICKYRSITTGLRSTVRANKKWRQNSAMARIRHVGGGEKKNDINMRNSNVGIIEKKNFR